MINEEWVLAIIPARGGSKRLPGKNLLKYQGLSLVLHAVKQASESRYIDHIILSSDDPLILNQGHGYVPLKRPPHLALDSTTSEAVIVHALYSLPRLPDWFVLLQPTSPLRSSGDIDATLEAARGTGCAVSVRPNGSRNGAIYCSYVPSFLSSLRFDNPKTYEMPESRSVDIDTQEDFDPLALM